MAGSAEHVVGVSAAPGDSRTGSCERSYNSEHLDCQKPATEFGKSWFNFARRRRREYSALKCRLGDFLVFFFGNQFFVCSQYLGVVDIPQEELLEVIDKLKEGTLLDKIIRDLEGGDAAVAMDKEETSAAVASAPAPAVSSKADLASTASETVAQVEENLPAIEAGEAKKVVQEAKSASRTTGRDEETAVTGAPETGAERAKMDPAGLLEEKSTPVAVVGNVSELPPEKHGEDTKPSTDTSRASIQQDLPERTHQEPAVSVAESDKKESLASVPEEETPDGSDGDKIENLQKENIFEVGGVSRSLKSQTTQMVEFKDKEKFVEQPVKSETKMDETPKSSSEKLAQPTKIDVDVEEVAEEVKKIAEPEKKKEVSKNMTIERSNEKVGVRQNVTVAEPSPEKGNSVPSAAPKFVESIEVKRAALEEVVRAKEVPQNQASSADDQRGAPEQSKVCDQNTAANAREQPAHECEKAVQEESSKDAAQSKVKKSSRKRRNTSESSESSAKVAKISDVAENPNLVADESSASARQLNITIKDLKHGGLETQEQQDL